MWWANTTHGCKNKLFWTMVLLDDKEKFEDQFQETHSLEHGADIEGAEEDRIAFNKSDKVFCESLVFCDLDNLWENTMPLIGSIVICNKS